MNVYDVVVAGAGPSGSVAARQLAGEGLSVLLLDRETFPRRKVCGACIGPAALELLDQVGLRSVVDRSQAVHLSHVMLVHDGRSAAVPLAGNVALSRAVFDSALVAAAVEAGVTFRDGVTVTMLAAKTQHVDVGVREDGVESTVRGRVVIDASGLAGLRREATVAPDARIGVAACFEDAGRLPPLHELRMVVGQSGYVGLVRVEDGSVNVAAAVDRSALAAGAHRAVNSILLAAGEAPLGAATHDGWKGTRALTTRPDALATTRVFRIGDAAGYVEPFTGEGMGWGIAGAIAVVPHVRSALRGWSEDLIGAWTRTHRKHIAGNQRICSGVSTLLRRPHLVGAALRVLEPAPMLAAPFVRATSRAARVRVAS